MYKHLFDIQKLPISIQERIQSHGPVEDVRFFSKADLARCEAWAQVKPRADPNPWRKLHVPLFWVWVIPVVIVRDFSWRESDVPRFVADRIWVDTCGREIPYAELTTDHIKNILALFRKGQADPLLAHRAGLKEELSQRQANATQ